MITPPRVASDDLANGVVVITEPAFQLGYLGGQLVVRALRELMAPPVDEKLKEPFGFARYRKEL